MSEGLVLLDKPPGPTSHDIVAAVRKAMGGARCGHAGTLDPFASGLLLVAVGSATRLLRFLAGSEKTYEGLARLGYATATDDATGSPLAPARPPEFEPGDLDRAITSLEGEIEQLVPAYSARKHAGVPRYKLARTGRTVPAATIRVQVRWKRAERVAPDLLRFVVEVSAGAYVRALARDLGERLGCGAHLQELRRVSAGPFRVTEALALPIDRQLLENALIPVDAIPLPLPAAVLHAEAVARARTGGVVSLTASMSADGWIRLLDEGGRLVAIAEGIGQDAGATLLQPRVVLPRAG